MIEKKKRRFTALLLMCCLLVQNMAVLTGCGTHKVQEQEEKPIHITVYDPLSSYAGMQIGWGAKLLKDKFNVELEILSMDTNQTSNEGDIEINDDNQGDIMILDSHLDSYQKIVQSGCLYDWNQGELLERKGAYIQKNMQGAIQKNRQLTEKITAGESDTLYGIGNDIAWSDEDHKGFQYTWDLRYDLYQELDCPEVNSLENYARVLEQMQQICPQDDNGNPVYGVTGWSDGDDSGIYMINQMVQAYYGYALVGMGYVNTQEPSFQGLLDEKGAYMAMVEFYHNLYQKGVLDPDAATQTYDQATEKVTAGGILSSLQQDSGSLIYNTEAHKDAGKAMYSLKPTQAMPATYGISTQGGIYVSTINAKTEYPELCMEILNYFATPEGRMNMAYGPKGLTWDYDENGRLYFTKLGRKCMEDGSTELTGEYAGSFADGSIQARLSTWSSDAQNPDSNNETYNSERWLDNTPVFTDELEQLWRDTTGCACTEQYFEKGKYTVLPDVTDRDHIRDKKLDQVWERVSDTLCDNTWKAICAQTENEYVKALAQLRVIAQSKGYAKCLLWSQKQYEQNYIE